MACLEEILENRNSNYNFIYFLRLLALRCRLVANRSDWSSTDERLKKEKCISFIFFWGIVLNWTKEHAMKTERVCKSKIKLLTVGMDKRISSFVQEYEKQGNFSWDMLSFMSRSHLLSDSRLHMFIAHTQNSDTGKFIIYFVLPSIYMFDALMALLRKNVTPTSWKLNILRCCSSVQFCHLFQIFTSSMIKGIISVFLSAPLKKTASFDELNPKYLSVWLLVTNGCSEL